MSPAGSPLSESDMGSSKEQDRFLPIANVSRIMKRSLPANAKISKEAKETVQECISEFISFITGEASDKCQREKRKTINGDDLLWAMTTLGFDSYVAPLKSYLNSYRENEGDKNTMARQQQPADGADHEKSLSDDGSGSGGGIVNPAVAGVDGGFYSPVTTPGFGVGYHAFLGRMDGEVHDEEGIHGGGRASLPSHLHGVHW